MNKKHLGTLRTPDFFCKGCMIRPVPDKDTKCEWCSNIIYEKKDRVDYIELLVFFTLFLLFSVFVILLGGLR